MHQVILFHDLSNVFTPQIFMLCEVVLRIGGKGSVSPVGPEVWSYGMEATLPVLAYASQFTTTALIPVQHICGVAASLFALAIRKLKGNLTLNHSYCWLLQTVTQNRCQVLFRTMLDQTGVSKTETSLLPQGTGSS